MVARGRGVRGVGSKDGQSEISPGCVTHSIVTIVIHIFKSHLNTTDEKRHPSTGAEKERHGEGQVRSSFTLEILGQFRIIFMLFYSKIPEYENDRQFQPKLVHQHHTYWRGIFGSVCDS